LKYLLLVEVNGMATQKNNLGKNLKPSEQTKETLTANPELAQIEIGQFPIVGIGASAGGLNAIQKLLENLPENTGLAFVVIQHLAATQESMLPEILSRSTKMPVTKVADEMPVEINHVYVIPSGVTMTISNGSLKLRPKGASFKPIDEFLRSLAAERKTQAIGIILSGTGTDGTEGLKFIKAEGGITFAQDPKTAQYPDMPRNAIAEETTYFVLSPEQIAQELSSIAKHPEITRKKMETEEPQKKGSDTETIFALLQAAFGVNFSNYKHSTVDRRISRRIVLNKIENLKKYVIYLRTHKQELQALFDDLLIGVTGFFREPPAFELLREKIFPNILEKKQPNQNIRVWIPGCSTGEEVYSVAIALEEFLDENNIVDRQIQIFGTDVNEKNIEKARHGVYLKTIEDVVSKNRLKRFFTSNNGNYQVIKPIRDMCIFAKHDLARDPPFSNMNLIVCRNLLIYFDSKLQERIIPLFHYGLKPDGYLVLGEAESVGKFTYLFEPLTKKGIVFKKKQAQPTFELQLEPSPADSMRRPLGRPEKADSMAMIEKEVDKLLMSEYVPASLLLNNNLDIVVFRGKIDSYISIDAGAASFNVAKIVQKELRPALQTAVHRAKKDQRNVEDTVRFKQDHENRIVNIQVKPLKIPRQDETFFFVLFSEAAKVRVPTQKEERAGKKAVDGAKDQQIRELSEDLNSTKLTLQTIIEQQEATNEELRSAMEEVQSSNEELMSTNEELESSKEELQSTNEELTTLNDELKNRNQRLTVLNDDLSNLMGSVETAVIIVDSSFKIRRFTSQAQELLRLLPTDIDHPINDIRLGIPIDDLEKSLLKVTSKLEMVRQEIKTEKGRWYQMRIRPYLTSEKKINGAVLSFSDVTEMKKLESEKQLHTDNLEQQVKAQARDLIDAEALSAIGKTAGMVGHDIRNPLQSIAGDVYLARTELAEMPDGKSKESIRESLDGVEKNVEYINKIVQDLQDYAKPYKPVAEETDLETLCQEVLFKNGIPENIDTDCKINNNVKKIITDRSMLKRALNNLVSNAVQAMPNGGKLTLNAYEETGSTVIEVQDNGVGIPENVKAKMFTPLFTTKARGQGFGLAVVKRLTEAMGGTVNYESELGKGTKFIIRLPPPKEINGKWVFN
jgi:two-component system CheB/CheR fusion protein